MLGQPLPNLDKFFFGPEKPRLDTSCRLAPAEEQLQFIKWSCHSGTVFPVVTRVIALMSKQLANSAKLVSECTHPGSFVSSVLRWRTGNEDLHGPCGDTRRFCRGSFLTQHFFSYRSGLAMATAFADSWLLVIFRFESREPLPTWDFSTAKSEMTLRSVVLVIAHIFLLSGCSRNNMSANSIHINIYIKSPNVLLAALGSFIHES